MKIVRDYKKFNINIFTVPQAHGYYNLKEVYDDFFKNILILNESAFNISEPLYANEISDKSLGKP